MNRNICAEIQKDGVTFNITPIELWYWRISVPVIAGCVAILAILIGI